MIAADLPAWDGRELAVEQIPSAAYQWRRPLLREARAVWGLGAPAADFAAQIHQESGWRPDAVSRAGALGMAQFMQATATWIVQAYPDLGPAIPASPQWAIRAMIRYDLHLWERVAAVTPCDRMAKALSAYNGGLGWVLRDERTAAAAGLDHARWWGHVEAVNAGRSAANWRENRGYPLRILYRAAPAYDLAGWPGRSCERQ